MEPALFGGRIFHSRKKEAVSEDLGTLRRYVGETAALGGTGGREGGEGGGRNGNVGYIKWLRGSVCVGEGKLTTRLNSSI